MSEYVTILREAIGALPEKTVALLLSLALVGMFVYHVRDLAALSQALEDRLVPMENVVGEQTPMLRYLVCVDRKGGANDPLVRQGCADDHLSESLRGILGDR